MKAAGTEKQEGRLSELASVVHTVFPEVDLPALKGCFRLAIDQALKEHYLESWTELMKADAEARVGFFDQVIEGVQEWLARLKLDGARISDATMRLRSVRDSVIDSQS